jgi:hypothetical protein
MCSALAFYAFILTFSVTRISVKLDAAAEVFSYLVTALPETFALAALSFMAVCVLACLLASHAFLVAKNEVRAYIQIAFDLSIMCGSLSCLHISQIGQAQAVPLLSTMNCV